MILFLLFSNTLHITRVRRVGVQLISYFKFQKWWKKMYCDIQKLALLLAFFRVQDEES
mgnify:FL=1